FAQGKLARSAGPFDLAIDGPGFFTLVDARGRRFYTRDGEFSRASDGSLRNARDLKLAGIVLPSDALSATVALDGTVRASFTAGTRALGRIRLAEFSAPERLRSIDGSLFEATGASGKPREITPGGDDAPKLRFGMLEESNVTVIDAMMQILTAQRAYEANAKGVQAADEMLRIANNLQRG
ncbi:MAG TPA: flagellar hook-basal body complex protein, partial [Candidatus Nitrosotalea sp.]|nr:flagellar hook-basal body complex protein [Candidatus Nitrosotalea sp.]